MKKYFIFFFFFSSIICSPLGHIKDYLVRRYCLRPDSFNGTAWLCAYYFALQKDLFKRESIYHPKAQYNIQHELWRDFWMVKHMVPLRIQLDILVQKYQLDWPSSRDCFDELNEKKLHERSTYLPCIHLVNEFRKEIKKQRKEV